MFQAFLVEAFIGEILEISRVQTMNEADPTGAKLVGFSSSITLQRSVTATLEAPSAGLWER